ncbi:hypothetical protein CLF_110048 [Clonorchis sinensis]|uniref:Uncharacterized protein n=1 Tax=Clonorchis sinensis TaxID=79923 RepID=G7YT57_CLOSI|nr:hypothetical protein CLF_110048 [Clonorchis sinensis]
MRINGRRNLRITEYSEIVEAHWCRCWSGVGCKSSLEDVNEIRRALGSPFVYKTGMFIERRRKMSSTATAKRYLRVTLNIRTSGKAKQFRSWVSVHGLVSRGHEVELASSGGPWFTAILNISASDITQCGNTSWRQTSKGGGPWVFLPTEKLKDLTGPNASRVRVMLSSKMCVGDRSFQHSLPDVVILTELNWLRLMSANCNLKVGSGEELFRVARTARSEGCSYLKFAAPKLKRKRLRELVLSTTGQIEKPVDTDQPQKFSRTIASTRKVPEFLPIYLINEPKKVRQAPLLTNLAVANGKQLNPVFQVIFHLSHCVIYTHGESDGWCIQRIQPDLADNAAEILVGLARMYATPSLASEPAQLGPSFWEPKRFILLNRPVADFVRNVDLSSAREKRLAVCKKVSLYTATPKDDQCFGIHYEWGKTITQENGKRYSPDTFTVHFTDAQNESRRQVVCLRLITCGLLICLRVLRKRNRNEEGRVADALASYIFAQVVKMDHRLNNNDFKRILYVTNAFCRVFGSMSAQFVENRRSAVKAILVFPLDVRQRDVLLDIRLTIRRQTPIVPCRIVWTSFDHCGVNSRAPGPNDLPTALFRNGGGVLSELLASILENKTVPDNRRESVMTPFSKTAPICFLTYSLEILIDTTRYRPESTERTDGVRKPSPDLAKNTHGEATDNFSQHVEKKNFSWTVRKGSDRILATRTKNLPCPAGFLGHLQGDKSWSLLTDREAPVTISLVVDTVAEPYPATIRALQIVRREGFGIEAKVLLRRRGLDNCHMYLKNVTPFRFSNTHIRNISLHPP